MQIDRLAMLLFAALFSASSYASGKFDGVWQSCDWLQQENSEICTVAVIHEKQGKVCGFWYYWATYREYEGRFIGRANGDSLKWTSVCGRPGSRATTECPASSEIASTLKGVGKDAYAELQWSKTNERALLCRGKLYEFDNESGPKTCSDLNLNSAPSPLVKRSLKSKKSKPGEAVEDAIWLKQCLSK